MSDDSKLEHMPPLGKSVEEVEQDNQNRVNPPAPGHDTTSDANVDEVAPGAPLPIANTSLGGVGGTFAAGASPLVGLTADPDDPEERPGSTTTRTNDDFTENSEA